MVHIKYYILHLAYFIFRITLYMLHMYKMMRMKKKDGVCSGSWRRVLGLISQIAVCSSMWPGNR